MDSHEHLFFECTFSSKVWVYVHDLADLDGVSPLLQDIISVLQPMGNSRNYKRSPKDIRDCIMVTVRLKLLTFKFKNTYNVKRLLERWKMPMTFRLCGC
ncbi:hypothetical protein Tco_0231542 [Tanacetum coccineum]